MSAADIPWQALGLVPVKLGRPRVDPQALARPRVSAAIAAAAARPLTLLVGQAGAGKTAALAAWAAGCGLPVAWWTLGEEETASGRWLAYLLAALATARPGLAPPRWPGDAAEPIAWLGEHVVVPLCRDDAPLVLVLDEVERASAPAFWRDLAWLFDHVPPGLRIVLAGRAAPPLPLARYEAAGALARVDAATLALDADETAAVARGCGGELDARAAAWLYARTQGWPAGVRLLARALAERPELAAAGPTPLDRRALDYLAEEVFAGLPAPRRRFLLDTAIADELEPDLCAALSGRADAGDELWRLVDAGLFVAPVDGPAGGVRLRYHPLFAAMLRRRLAEAPDEARALHARAARWCAAAGRLERAVHHCAAADEPALAAELAAAHGFTLVRARALGELGRLVALALRGPADPRRGLLRTLAAWAALPGDSGAAREVAREAREAVQALPDPARATLSGSLDALEAFLELRAGAPAAALERARAALSGPVADNRGLAVALQLAAGLAAEALGRFAEALGHLEAAASAAAVAPAMPSQVPALGHRVRVLRRLGRLGEAEALGAAAESAARGLQLEGSAPAGAVALERAMVARDRGDLERAESLALAGLALVRLGDDREDVARGAIALARIRRDRGDRTGADDAAAEATAVAATLDLPWLRALAEVERDPAGALRVPASDDRWPQAGLVRTAACLAAAEAALREAGGELGGRAGRALAPSERRRLVEALAREQAAAAAEGRETDALSVGVARAALLADEDPVGAAAWLGELVARAGAERHVRPFAVHAARLRPLLARLDPAAQRAARDLLGEPAPAAPAVAEPLSAREREVLALVALGLSNQWIARRLFVSLATVKTHLHNILGKLAVDNRTAAVRRGRALGLIAGE